jgi:hypothetical protein
VKRETQKEGNKTGFEIRFTGPEPRPRLISVPAICKLGGLLEPDFPEDEF